MSKEEVLEFIRRYESRVSLAYEHLNEDPKLVIEYCLYMTKDLSENRKSLSRKTFGRLNAKSKKLEEKAESILG